MYTIREFPPDEYPAVVAVENAVWSDLPVTEAELRHTDSHQPPGFQRVVVETGGQIVASGAYGPTHQTGRFRINLAVHPDHQRHGIGTAWFDWTLSRLPDAKALIAITRDDQPGGPLLLDRQGFTLTVRQPHSRLDVAAFDPAPFAEVDAYIKEEAIMVQTLADLQATDPHWLQKWYGLHCLILKAAQSEEIPSLESFKAGMDHPGFRAAAVFVAVEEVSRHYVALSNLRHVPAAPDKLRSALTGVLPEYRHKGLATALRLRAIDYAREQGIAVIETGVNENNPMQRLNTRMGFTPVHTWLTYERAMLDEGM